MGLSEYYIVAIKKETELYPFGGEGPVPYFYKTAELYANVCLIYGLIFLALILFGIWNWKTKKVNDLIVVGIIIIMIILWFAQGNIG
jgi:hypothetical protein